eukprot:1392785-Rhodomonas_salina.2
MFDTWGLGIDEGLDLGGAVVRHEHLGKGAHQIDESSVPPTKYAPEGLDVGGPALRHGAP